MSSDSADVYSCIIIGAGLVGTAAAAHLSQIVAKRDDNVIQGPIALVGTPTGLPFKWSSHDDYTRLVDVKISSNEQDAKRSVAGYRNVEQTTGIPFFHETGCLVVSGSDMLATPTENAEAGVCSVLMSPEDIHCKWPFMNVTDLATTNASPARAVFEPAHAGWIDPRAHVQAHKKWAVDQGVHVIEQQAVAVARDDRVNDDEQVVIKNWSITTADGSKLHAQRIVFALGAWTNLAGVLPHGIVVPLDLWGKCVFHARISDTDAATLLQRNMPPVLLKFSDENAPADAVSYKGTKKGFYVYFFPPVQYSDHTWYVKIGHSPYDPLISSLAGTSLSDKLNRWMSCDGDDVHALLTKSEMFFKATLRHIFPEIGFDGGYVSTCVTSKTTDGNVFLGALSSLNPNDEQVDSEGLFICAGCNGAGAKVAHEWGRQLAELAARG